MGMPSVYAVATANSGTTALLVAMPAGTVANDILVMFLENQDATGIGSVTGFSPILAQYVNTGTATRLTALWKRAVGGDTSVSVPDPGDHVSARVVGVRGCVTSGNPWNVTSNASDLTANTSVSIPGATTTAADCLVLAAFSTGTDVAANSTTHVSGWANASLANVTEQVDNWYTTGLGGGIGVASGEKAAAGAYGATTATIAAADFKAMMTIALQGAGAAAAAVTPPRRRGPNYRR